MIKLFSLIFYLCFKETRGDVYVVNPTSTSKSKAQTQFEIKNYNNELMSHLLCLNSCDNYPNKCPHICLHLLVKQRPIPQGHRQPLRTCLSRDAHYTHSDCPCKVFCSIISGVFPMNQNMAYRAPEPPFPGALNKLLGQGLAVTDR